MKFYLMDEGVDLLEREEVSGRTWEAYDRYAGKLLWEREVTSEKVFVLGTKYLLEVEDSSDFYRKISAIDLKTGSVKWYRSFEFDDREWNINAGSHSLLLEYKYYQGSDSRLLDSIVYQVIDAAEGIIGARHANSSGYSAKIGLDDIRRLQIHWGDMDYYIDKRLFFSESQVMFYEGTWDKDEVDVKEIAAYWVLHQRGKYYLEDGILVLLSKLRNNRIPRFLEYDGRQKVGVWDKYLVKVENQKYFYYKLEEGVSLEKKEWRSSNLLKNKGWLEMENGTVKWMIEQSKTHLYLNDVVNIEQKKIQMKHIGAKRELKKEGDWLYIYEMALIEEDNKSSGVVYKYKLPIDFESQ